jgi:hypothetical protein
MKRNGPVDVTVRELEQRGRNTGRTFEKFDCASAKGDGRAYRETW